MRSAWARDKSKLNFEQQVRYLKDGGITFELLSEEEAVEFLQSETYFNKVTAFVPLWPKNNQGLYQKLDFGHLVALWRIDKKLSNVFALMTLEIEAAAKARIVFLCDEKDNEDGYSLVDDFWHSLSYGQKKSLNTDLHVNAERRMLEGSPWMDKSYLEELLDCYELDLPVWVLMLTAFYKTLCEFYQFCGKRWNDESMIRDSYLLEDAKTIRNLCAHNNGLLADFKEPSDLGKLIKSEVVDALVEQGVNEAFCLKQMKNRRMRELLSVLFYFRRIVREHPAKHREVVAMLSATVDYIRSQLDLFAENKRVRSILLLLADAAEGLVISQGVQGTM